MDFNTLHKHISNIAFTSPDKIAIQQGDHSVSYRELDAKGNQIANFLYAKLNDNKNIPVMLENSIELVESILGILKAGGIFAPIDHEFPENRIQLMVDKIDADWVITRAKWLSKLDRMMEGLNRKINALVVDLNTFNEGKFTNIDVFAFDSTLSTELQIPEEMVNKHCYIYFTSGSTGKPKAILGRHRSLKHFIDWEISEFGMDESFKVSQLISPSFDPFLRDVFVPLCAGATLCIPVRPGRVYILVGVNPTKVRTSHPLCIESWRN
ncbi:MAG: AMP-binding protein [Halanaerobiales bacterium]|nr:AMP-binding protein [Halanaerobiales bacterium]